MQSHVFPLFPVALYVNTYIGDTNNIVKYFDSCEMNPTNDGYGSISKNSYILDNPITKPLADFFMACFEEYATSVMRYKYESLAFAQSWLTHKEPGQIHKVHTHPNSLLAGVFYYDVQPGDAAICFSKEVKSLNRSYLEPALLDDYQNNPFSQEEIYFTPSQNNFIIFPSWLSHGVPPNNTNRTRKALGVNILTKNTLGKKHEINEIIFGRHA